MGARRTGRSFGAGSYARRHQQGYQALTGAIVMGLAVSTLTLHHFGFGLALLCAMGAAGICAVARVRATVGVYVVGAALLGGILLAPPHGIAQQPMPGGTPAAYTMPLDSALEMYVLKESIAPGRDDSLPHLELESKGWSSPADDPDVPQLFEL